MATLEIYVEQAPDTAKEYMLRAIRIIDETFEPGYAQAHPELVGAFIQTCASDFLGGMIHEATKRLSADK